MPLYSPNRRTPSPHSSTAAARMRASRISSNGKLVCKPGTTTRPRQPRRHCGNGVRKTACNSCR